jgi:hypothetical protein
MYFDAKQMREDALIKKGTYKFRVLQGREKRASTGTEMLNLKLMLTINHREVQYYTSLFLLPSMFWMVEHFCKATRIEHKIEEGCIMAQDVDGLQGGYVVIDHRVNKETGEVEAYTKDFLADDELPINDDIPNFN